MNTHQEDVSTRALFYNKGDIYLCQQVSASPISDLQRTKRAALESDLEVLHMTTVPVMACIACLVPTSSDCVLFLFVFCDPTSMYASPKAWSQLESGRSDSGLHVICVYACIV